MIRTKLALISLFVVLIFTGGGAVAHAQTSAASSPEQIQAILKQIQIIREQISELQAKQATLVTELSGAIKLTRQLKQGTTGEEVENLQKLLAADSEVYPEKLVTGFFGPMTERAVRRFQAKQGIEQVGEVGPQTRSALMQLASAGSTVTICHYPPGNPSAKQTLTIGAPAWGAHQAHGDTLGQCGGGGGGEATTTISHNSNLGRNVGASSSISLANVSPSGSNRLLVCTITAEHNFPLTAGPSFNGSNFTQLGSNLATGDGPEMYSVWYLVAPSTTSGSVSATLSTSTVWGIWCDSYTGVAQTSPFANVVIGGNTPNYITTSPTNITNTSSLSGSWQFASAISDSGATAIAITGGGVQRENGPLSTNINEAHFDSNASINSGSSNTMTITHTGGGQKFGYISAMMLPVH